MISIVIVAVIVLVAVGNEMRTGRDDKPSFFTRRAMRRLGITLDNEGNEVS